MKLPFRAKIWKQGNSWVVTIPSQYVKNGVIPQDKELPFTIDV